MDACSPSQPALAPALRRLGWALAASFLVHLLLIVSLKAGLPPQAAHSSGAIEARIAPLDPPQAQFQAQAEISEPVLQSVQDVVDAVAPAEIPSPAQPVTARAQPEPVTEPAERDHRIDAGSVAPSREPTYYAITALDRPPVPLSPPDACYPDGATEEVEYELLIDENGTVNRAVVLSVRPVGLFTAAAEELCAAVRFSPAVKDGRTVKSKIRLVLGRR